MEEHLVIQGNINVNSPLVYDDTMTGALRTYAAANQGNVVSPFILGGAMSPVTQAALIAQAHAEAMVGIALTQLVRKGSPVVYGSFLTTMDLKTGAPTFGTPESSLACLAIAQLCRRLGLPFRCGGHLTASKVADAQAMQESTDTMNPAIMADAFLEAGVGNNFLGVAHTLKNFESANYRAELADNNSFEQWTDLGSKDTQERAYEVWTRMLKTYEAPPIDPGVDEELQAFVARRKGSMADAWY